MKVFITKNALRDGIVLKEVTQFLPDVVELETSIGSIYFKGRGKEWHLNKASAQARALKMRDDALHELETRQLQLKHLDFTCAHLPDFA